MDLQIPLTFFLAIEPGAVVITTVCVLVPALAMEVILLKLTVILVTIRETIGSRATHLILGKISNVLVTTEVGETSRAMFHTVHKVPLVFILI
jgi:hypothetical protein